MTFIDLVLVKHDGNNKPYLFQAPAWSYLKKGETVVVQNRFGEKFAEVIGVMTTNTENEAYEMIIKACGVIEPLGKVVAKVDYSKFKYPEDSTPIEYEEKDDE